MVVDRRSQSEALGELRSAIAAGALPRRIAELRDVLTGAAPGRPGPDAVTVCDLTGTGAQDTAIATHALALCRAARAGTVMTA